MARRAIRSRISGVIPVMSGRPLQMAVTRGDYGGVVAVEEPPDLGQRISGRDAVGPGDLAHAPHGLVPG